MKSYLKKSFFLVPFLLLCPMVTFGQSVTYYHDESVMQQFTVGETGAGSLRDPVPLYYQVTHNNYRNTAAATNKLFFRMQMKYVQLDQVPHSEVIDSALTERLHVEEQNIADRMAVADVAWQFERDKVERKLASFKDNIEHIQFSGGDHAVYLRWQERYKAVTCGLEAVRDAYMPQGKRKEQYLCIYNDIVSQNGELERYLKYLRSVREAASLSSLPSTVVTRPNTGFYAQYALGHFSNSLAACSNTGNVSPAANDVDRWQRISRGGDGE